MDPKIWLDLNRELVMNINEIVARLKDMDFFIYRVKRIPFGAQILLGCGPSITVYNKGTVYVQGNFFNERVLQESLPMLQGMLPAGTKRGVGVR